MCKGEEGAAASIRTSGWDRDTQKEAHFQSEREREAPRQQQAQGWGRERTLETTYTCRCLEQQGCSTMSAAAPPAIMNKTARDSTRRMCYWYACLRVCASRGPVLACAWSLWWWWGGMVVMMLSERRCHAAWQILSLAFWTRLDLEVFRFRVARRPTPSKGLCRCGGGGGWVWVVCYYWGCLAGSQNSRQRLEEVRGSVRGRPPA